jgi:hypothetical protein
MVNLPRCITQGVLQILRFQIGEIGQDLLAALPSGNRPPKRPLDSAMPALHHCEPMMPFT